MTRPAPGDDDPGLSPAEDPVEVGAEDIVDAPPAARSPGRLSRFPRWVRLAIAAALVAAGLGGVYAYRARQQRRIVELSVARARQLVRSDTWLGEHRAADLLGVRAAQLDPTSAGALRALALALLAADYRDAQAAADANAALVEPMRAAHVPVEAELAFAALALRDGKGGTAIEYANRGGESALGEVVAARVAILAGNGAAAADSVDRALAADGELPAALALRGDLLRRARRPAEARAAYAAALDASARALAAGLDGRDAAPAPHPRAAFGLAKLALSREIAPDDAMGPLRRLAADPAGTPQTERARAALYLSALQARAGDRAGAAATIDASGLDAGTRAWLQRASGQLEVEKGPYRVPDGTPTSLVSASDDDPYLPPPPPPPRVEPPPKPVLHGLKVHPVAKKKPAKAAHPKAHAKKKGAPAKHAAKTKKNAKKKQSAPAR